MNNLSRKAHPHKAAGVRIKWAGALGLPLTATRTEIDRAANELPEGGLYDRNEVREAILLDFQNTHLPL